MKGIDKDKNIDKVVIEAQKQFEKKRVLLGSVKPHPNQRCFEINTLTNEIKEADYKYSATFNNGTKKSIDVKENCQYVIAINKTNALKKYNKNKL